MWAVKRLGVLCGVGGLGYAYDYKFAHRRLHRNLTTFYGAGSTIWDYKVRYSQHPESIEEIHERVANRLGAICAQNGGLYIKLGQGVASLTHILPPQYRKAFVSLQDQAPTSPYTEIEALFKQEFGGKLPSEIFAEFDEVPVASASIAQVHKAVLHDGTQVAVKIQKPAIRYQMEWDLLTYQILMYTFDKIFDLPMYWVVDFTKKTLLRETDFLLEAVNTMATRDTFLDPSCPSDLKDRVYVPKVFSKFSTSRVMVCEWVEGVKISDEEGLREKGLDGYEAAHFLIRAFGFQIFQTGFVHCDPHPGNVLVRKGEKGNTQIVLLDHGMYVRETEEFRRQYCDLWQAIFLLDKETLVDICHKWGINDPEFFASIQLMRPFSLARPPHLSSVPPEELKKLQRESKDRFRELLKQSEKIPRELIFIGRCLNLIRATNRELGSKVNRIDVLAGCAAQGGDWSWLSWVSFKTQLFLLTVYHTSSSCLQWFGVSPPHVPVSEITGMADPDDEEEEEMDELDETLEEKMGFRLRPPHD